MFYICQCRHPNTRQRTKPTKGLIDTLHSLLVGDEQGGPEAEQIESLLRKLPGVTSKSTPDEMASALSKWVLTLRGPGADVFWKLDHSQKGRPLPAADHSFAVCVNCLAFSTSGTCAHVYACGIDTGWWGSKTSVFFHEKSARGLIIPLTEYNNPDLYLQRLRLNEYSLARKCSAKHTDHQARRMINGYAQQW